MKLALAFFVCIGFYLSALSQTKVDTTFYQGTKKVRSIISTVGTVETTQLFHENGQLVNEYRKVDGKFEGLYKSFCADGKPSQLVMYTKGQYSGVYKNWNCGILELECHYKLILMDRRYKSIYHGEYGVYFENGAIKQIGTYENGEKIGTWKSYFQNGQLQTAVGYKNGKLSGINLSYFDDGTLSFEGRNVLIETAYGLDSKPDGICIFYHQNGKPRTIKKYQKGILLMEEEFAENGNQTLLRSYNIKGKWAGLQKAWYPNGQLKYEYTVLKGGYNGKHVYDGKFEQYYENGLVQEKGVYTKAGKNGQWIANYSNGQLKYKCSFLNDIPVDRYVEFHETGDTLKLETYSTVSLNGRDTSLLNGPYRFFRWNYLSESGEFLKGQKHGVWKLWSDQSKLSKVENFCTGQTCKDLVQYYPNGEIARKEQYEQLVNGEWKLREMSKYYPNGQLLSQEFYSGLGAEKWQESFYMDGHRLSYFLGDYYRTFSISLYPNGKVLEIDGYAFYPNGQVKGLSGLKLGFDGLAHLTFSADGKIMGGYMQNNRRTQSRSLSDKELDSFASLYKIIKAPAFPSNDFSGIWEFSIGTVYHLSLVLNQGQIIAVKNEKSQDELSFELDGGFLDGQRYFHDKIQNKTSISYYEKGMPVD